MSSKNTNDAKAEAAKPELPPLKAGDTPAPVSTKPEKVRVSRIPYERRKAMYGYGFIFLWIIGTLWFFLIPLMKSLYYSFCEVTVNPGSLDTEWVGLAKYKYALNTDPNYMDYLESTLLETLWKTPLILIFSLFIAVVLNQKFRGRILARAVFFLPVIIATGPVFKIINGDMDSTGNTGAQQFSTMFSTDLVGQLMQFLGVYGLSENMGTVISTVADNIFGIVWSSGIQILLFLVEEGRNGVFCRINGIDRRFLGIVRFDLPALFKPDPGQLIGIQTACLIEDQAVFAVVDPLVGI